MTEHGGAESCKTSCGDLGFHQYNQLCLSLTEQHRALLPFRRLRIPISAMITMDGFYTRGLRMKTITLRETEKVESRQRSKQQSDLRFLRREKKTHWNQLGSRPYLSKRYCNL